jgi:hypothetical protein
MKEKHDLPSIHGKSAIRLDRHPRESIRIIRLFDRITRLSWWIAIDNQDSFTKMYQQPKVVRAGLGHGPSLSNEIENRFS